MHKNPEHYGFSSSQSEQPLDDRLKELCINSIKNLSEAEIVTLDNEMNFYISPQPEAYIMTQNVINFQTMLMLMKIPTDCGVHKLLTEISLAEETHKTVTRNQKSTLNEMHKASRFSSKMKVKESSHKTFILLCAAIERVQIRDNSMQVEQMEIVEQTMRVSSAIHAYSLEKEKGRLLESVILVTRSLRHRMWETGYECIFSQAPGTNDRLIAAMIAQNLCSLQDLDKKSQADIQKILRCSASQAQKLLEFRGTCRSNQLSMDIDFSAPGKVVYHIKPSNERDMVHKKEIIAIPFQLVSLHVPTGKLVCYRYLKSGLSSYDIRVDLPEDMAPSDIYSSLLSFYVGLDTTVFAQNFPMPEHSIKTGRSRNLKQATLSTTKVTNAGALEAKKHEKAQQILNRKIKNTESVRKQCDESRDKIIALSSTSRQHSVKSSESSRSKPIEEMKVPSFDKFAYEEEKLEDAFAIADRNSKMSISGSMDCRVIENPELGIIRQKSKEIGLDNLNVGRLKRNISAIDTTRGLSPTSRFQEAPQTHNCNGTDQGTLNAIKRRHIDQINELLNYQKAEMEKVAMSIEEQKEAPNDLSFKKTYIDCNAVNHIEQKENKFFRSKRTINNDKEKFSSSDILRTSPHENNINELSQYLSSNQFLEPLAALSHSDDLAELSFGNSLINSYTATSNRLCNILKSVQDKSTEHSIIGTKPCSVFIATPSSSTQKDTVTATNLAHNFMDANTKSIYSSSDHLDQSKSTMKGLKLMNRADLFDTCFS